MRNVNEEILVWVPRDLSGSFLMRFSLSWKTVSFGLSGSI